MSNYENLNKKLKIKIKNKTKNNYKNDIKTEYKNSNEINNDIDCINKNENEKLIIIELLTFFLPLSIQKLIGNYYSYLHILIMFLGLSIVLFSNNIFYLFAVLLILCLDGIANILFQDCPISVLEKKYLGMSMTELKQKIYSKLGINFKCNHAFESQLEIIINVACAIVLKILIIIFCDIFNIKISIK